MSRSLCGALCWSVLLACSPTAMIAADNTSRRPPQYRYRQQSIPAASAEEARIEKFSSTAARDYLDRGAQLWQQQKQCVSCHTHGIYMSTRPALTPYWGRPPAELREFIVSQSRELIASGDRSASAPAKMAYLARGLAVWDAQFATATSAETDAALRHLLTLQAEDGSIRASYRWPPLNSDTYHATVMAALAVATAPDWQATLADETSDNRTVREGMEQLHGYLRETPPEHDHQRLLLLWAATRTPNLLTAERRQAFLEAIWLQQRPDGGWSTRTFATPTQLGGGRRALQLRDEPDFANPPSDGYQTGLVVVVLRDAGIPAADPRLQRAVQWLLSNQRESGRWWTPSLNVDSRFHYITYSGTAYAALALARCDALPGIDP